MTKELNQGIKFKCNKKDCETIWRAAEVLHFHLYDTHKTNENVCDICGKIFPYNVANLKRHKENTHFLKRDYQVWQYGLWSFQTGGTKLERFLPKNQHTQRKSLNFENWVNGEVSKIGHHFSK